MRIHTNRSIGAALLTVSLAVSATACGAEDAGSGDSSQVSTTEHNQADVAFASDMVQHHAQALSMVDLTLGRTLDPEVQALAEQIRETQAPEIETLTDWLTDWDEVVPETMRDHVNSANAGHHGGDMSDSLAEMEGMDTDMPGMLSVEDIETLESAADADFQDIWLELMIQHHTGAIEMAGTEQKSGQYQPTIELAKSIIASQGAEIDTMTQLRS